MMVCEEHEKDLGNWQKIKKVKYLMDVIMMYAKMELQKLRYANNYYGFKHLHAMPSL